MEASFLNYDFSACLARIPNVLDNSDNSYEDRKDIPSHDLLTYENGFYVNASVIFVDMRDSSSLSGKHTRPVLAKIFRTYITETIAILRGNPNIQEIYIEGDGVWGAFSTPLKLDINSVFSTAAQISSIVDVLNIFYMKKNYSSITIGTGISYGSSLYIKGGYKGSGINETVWLGKVVGEAAHLASFGNKTFLDQETMVSNIFYDNLNDQNKLLLSQNANRACYHGNIINTFLDAWVKENLSK